MRETEMHKPVKRLLMDKILCDDVYAEVMNVDLLATRGPVNVIVEMKASLTFKLIEQAYRDLRYAQYVYIAIPATNKSYHFAYHTFLWPHKVGLILVNGCTAFVKHPARYKRISINLREYIRNQVESFSKDNIAGSKSGAAITRYSDMINKVKRYMSTSGWLTVDEILDHCETYYAQPKPSMMATLKMEQNSGWCEHKVVNGKTYFRYRQENGQK